MATRGRTEVTQYHRGVHRERLQAAFDARDLDRLVPLMDEGIVWRGVPRPEEEGGIPVCTDRDQVRDQMQRLDQGGDADPLILAESGDSVLVEVRPHVRPHDHPPGDGHDADHDHVYPELWQVLTFRAGRMVLIQDYLDRSEAFAALG